jgi:hypothetical protein
MLIIYGRSHLNGRMILKWLLRNRVRKYGMDTYGLEYGPEADSCEFRNELSDSINSTHFLCHKSDYQLLKNVSVR